MEYHEFTGALKKSLDIDLSGYKVKQMQRRIESLMERHRCLGFPEYLQLLKNDAGIRNQFLNHVTINVTEFFRNPELYRCLKTQILPGLVQKEGTVKMWSAACSNGAEPYTLALIMQEAFGNKAYHIDATDIDEAMLHQAQTGTYSLDYVKNVSEEMLKRYFEINGEKVTIKKTAKKGVFFRRHNLLREPYPKGYDLIVCRNVTIYFTQEAQEHCYRSFAQSLNRGGILFIGSSENLLHYQKFGFDRVSTGFFRQVGSGA